MSFGIFATATASWTEPSASCNSTNDLFAPSVGIDSDGSATVEQAGVAADCSSGSPVYQAWYEMYPAAPVYYRNPVSAKDKITATVVRTGTSTYRLDISDTTKGWSKSVTKRSRSRRHCRRCIRRPRRSSNRRPIPIRTSPAACSSPGSRSMARTLPPQPTGLDADDHGTYTYRPRPTGPDGAGSP